MRALNRISTEWSPDLAYVVGLIASDGSLSKDKRHIDITSKDKALLERVSTCLNVANKIGTKSNGSRRQVHYRIQLGDVTFYRWLESLGLTPNKSKTLAAIDVPDVLFGHFLRGCFDGDGSIWSYWDQRWKNSFIFYMTFTGASPLFLRWLQNNNNRLFQVKGSINTTIRCEQLRYGKRETQLLYKVMYPDLTIPYLARKQIKLVEIFAQNPYA